MHCAATTPQHGRGTARIELITDDKLTTLPKIPKKKGKEKAVPPESTSAMLGEAEGKGEGEAVLELSQDQEELGEYVPDLREMFSSSSAAESEYFTDEELGKVKGKKKMKLRELSSDGSLSSSEDEGRRKRRKKKGGKAKQSSFSYNDDGNRSKYILRIR